MSVATQTKCPIYKRREPELSLIYQTVQNHWPAFVDNRNSEGRPLPKYVIEEMESYLRCGILTFGFVRLKCGDCENEMIVAFSCKKLPSATPRLLTQINPLD